MLTSIILMPASVLLIFAACVVLPAGAFLPTPIFELCHRGDKMVSISNQCRTTTVRSGHAMRAVQERKGPKLFERLRVSSTETPISDEIKRKTVLVTGSTGGVGSRTVAILLAKGVNVRALVRDEAKGNALLSNVWRGPGGNDETMVAADLTDGGSRAVKEVPRGRCEVVVGDVCKELPREALEGISAVVVCSAAIVRPRVVEDTTKLDSDDLPVAYRGVRFFEPEVVGDPQQIDFVGMKNILTAVKETSIMDGLCPPKAGDGGSDGSSEWGDLMPGENNLFAPKGATPVVVYVSSAYVTRPARVAAGLLRVEIEPPAVRMNQMLGGILTFKKEAEDLVRASGLPYAIVRPCALADGPGAATGPVTERELELAQGDNVRGKVARADVAALCVAALHCPEAAYKTFEVRSQRTPGKLQKEVNEMSILAPSFDAYAKRFGLLLPDDEKAPG